MAPIDRNAGPAALRIPDAAAARRPRPFVLSSRLRLLVAAAGVIAAAAASAADLQARLSAVAGETTAQLTTTGRKSGKPHTVPVWFIVGDGAIYLTTQDVKRDWVRNAEAHPEVTLAIRDVRVRGRLARVTEEELDHHIRDQRAQKYPMGRVAGWVGYTPNATFRMSELRDADAP
jgi:deazaflavin-dependent oxidoreductase (nitroreductase family)